MKRNTIFLCIVIASTLCGFMGVRYLYSPQEPELQENSSQENELQNEVQQESEITGSQERLEVIRQDDRVSITYYHEDEWLAEYSILSEDHWAYRYGCRGQLIIYGTPRGTPNVYISFADRYQVRSVSGDSIGSGGYFCREEEHAVLCAWAEERLQEWLSRLRSLDMDTLIEQARERVPFPENPDRYSPPSRD